MNDVLSRLTPEQIRALSPDQLRALKLNATDPTAPNNDALARIPPEQLAQMMGLGTLDERGAMLEQQMEQARALQGQPTTKRLTAKGATLSGLAGIGNAAISGYTQYKTGQQQKSLLDQKDAGRKSMLDAYRAEMQRREEEEMRRRLLQGQVPGSAGMGDGSSGFGFGYG